MTQAQVATRLDQVAGLERTEPKQWTWLEAAPAPARNARGGLALESTVSAGRVLGTLALRGNALTLSVNSARRAERRMALVKKAFGPLVKPPPTAIETIDQVRAERAESGAGEEKEEIAPEIARLRRERALGAAQVRRLQPGSATATADRRPGTVPDRTDAPRPYRPGLVGKRRSSNSGTRRGNSSKLSKLAA